MKSTNSSDWQIIPICIVCKTPLDDNDNEKAVCSRCAKILEAPYPLADEDEKERWKGGRKSYKRNRWNRRIDDNGYNAFRMYNPVSQYVMYR